MRLHIDAELTQNLRLKARSNAVALCCEEHNGHPDAVKKTRRTPLIEGQH
jgi:hypothetical protein